MACIEAARTGKEWAVVDWEGMGRGGPPDPKQTFARRGRRSGGVTRAPAVAGCRLVRDHVPSSRRIGLVLGAGGTVGCAYHAGVIYSLLHHLGWDARDAACVVGTSAGSLVGALLRCGVDPADLIALSRNLELSAANAGRVDQLRLANGRPGPSPLAIARSVRPPSLVGAMRTVRHRSVRPVLLSMTSGRGEDMRCSLAELDELAGGFGAWPDGDLRICTVDVGNGRRFVVDRTSGTPLSTAVSASCAVPGLFAPQRIVGRTVVDGGVHSTTNVDALDFATLDEVWVVAPMAGRTFHQIATRHMRRFIALQLRRELAAVPAGMRVRLFVPGRESSAAMGLDLMAGDRSDRTVLAGFLETGDLVTPH